MADSLLFQAAERVVRDAFDRETVRRGSSGAWLEAAWRALDDLGLPRALIPADQGGLGIDAAEAADMLRLVGYWAAPVPVADAMLGAALLADAGLPAPDHALTLAPPRQTHVRLAQRDGDWIVEGDAKRVPWARHAATIILVAEAEGQPHVVALPATACEISQGANLAGEPRDDITFNTTLPAHSAGATRFDAAAAHAAGAALRTVMIAGATHRMLDMAVQFANDHHQFGRPIAKFQAIQQNLAVLAGQAALCRACGDVAGQALFAPDGMLAIAMAKARAGEAAALAAHIAHQVHGAIAFTAEYDLQFFSKRVLAWREEFGAEAEWNAVVGQACLDEPEGAWALITRHERIA